MSTNNRRVIVSLVDGLIAAHPCECYAFVRKVASPKGNRTYVDAEIPGKSADFRLNWPRPVDSER